MKTALAATLTLVATLATPAAGQQQRDANTIYDPALFSGMEYRMVGPTRGGRVTAVAGHRAQPSTFYMGSTGGGVWKTTDYGLHWTNISDGFFTATASIGAIRVAESDPNIIYVGTGTDGIRSNVITGRGVYKSTDAGKTWTHMGLRDVGQIGRMAIHPTNPDVVLLSALGSAFGKSTHRGIYRTTDGGRSWNRVLFVSDSVGFYGLVMEPGNPNTLYAAAWRGERKPWTIISGAHMSAGVGIYKTTDGGETWNRLTNGLPTGLVGKIDLTISPANPARIYALVEAPEPADGLYRSDDRGATWTQVSSYNPILNRPFYYTNVHADPKNADIVWVNNEGFYKSVDAGKNWERVRTPHGDNHDMWINPDNPDIFVQSNDGGANVTQNGGETWTTQHNQPTAELYQVNVDDRFPYWLYAGQQDNSTIAVPSLPPFPSPSGTEGYWEEIGGCETGPAVPQPGGAKLVFSNCKGRFGRFSRTTGQEQQYYVGAVNLYGTNPKDLPYRFQRTVPIHVSPHDPNTVYHGSQYVHVTRDGGKTWEQISHDLTAFRPERQMVSGTPITRDITGEEHYSVLYTIAESPVQAGVIWAGANDGPIHATRNGGRSWTDVTPRDLPPEGRVNHIDPSPHQANKAYAAIYRFQLDDWSPYIYRTTDYGLTWTRLTNGSNGIPTDYPVRVVREDPEKEGLLYAGTEFGMFVSFNDGANWQPLQQNLPVTPITDIKVVPGRGDLAISTMGRSFWILDDVTPLRELSAQVAGARYHLFQPRAAYRMRYRTGGFFREPSASEPAYLPPGAAIHYYLAADAPGEVTLEILDANSRVVRRFSSEGPGETAETTQGMRAPQPIVTGSQKLARTAGMHRFIWDMEHAAPWAADPNRTGDGPLAVPGTYSVRFTAEGRSLTRSFELRPDPRVLEDGVTLADLRAQFELNVQARDELSAARALLARLREAKKGLGEGDKRQALGGIEAELTQDETPGIRYAQPMLIQQLGYLYNMTTTADQRPGGDAYARLEQLKSQRAALEGRLNQALGTQAGGN